MVYVIRPLIFSFTLPFNSLEYFDSVMTILAVFIMQFFESEAFTGGLPDVGHPLVMAPECDATQNFTYDDPLWLPANSTSTYTNLKNIGHRSAYQFVTCTYLYAFLKNDIVRNVLLLGFFSTWISIWAGFFGIFASIAKNYYTDIVTSNKK